MPAHHRAVDVLEDLAVVFVLVVVRVDIDDDEVAVLALHCLLGGVAQLIDRGKLAAWNEVTNVEGRGIVERNVHGRLSYATT